jgi:hypothetical protein
MQEGFLEDLPNFLGDLPKPRFILHDKKTMNDTTFL